MFAYNVKLFLREPLDQTLRQTDCSLLVNVWCTPNKGSG